MDRPLLFVFSIICVLIVLERAAHRAICTVLSNPISSCTAHRPAHIDVDVAVVGAGVSGLIAARELTRQGLTVAVIDAQNAVGGRSLRAEVLRDTPTPLWVDEGGMWVGATHTLLLDLISSYNLTLYDSASAVGKEHIFWGNASLVTDGCCWDCLTMPKPTSIESAATMRAAAAAAPEPFGSGLQDLMGLMEKLGELADTVNIAEPWLTPDAEAMDRITFYDWVVNNTSTELARRLQLLAVSEQGATNAEGGWTSLLHVARQLAAAPQAEQPERWLVKGGAGQLPPLLAADIQAAGGTIILSSPVRTITHSNDTSGSTLPDAVQSQDGLKGRRVVVQTDNSADVVAKAVIVAMPPHLAGRIQYRPPMPARRDQLTQHMPMGSLIKAIAVYQEPFWRVAGNNSGNTSMSFVFGLDPPSPVEVAFDISPPADAGGGGAGVLAAFLSLGAPALFGATPQERRALVLACFARWYGPEALTPVRYLEAAWPERPFTGGAYASYMTPGGWTSFGEALTAPVGRIFWAGTETSERWPGFYEGAIQAGLNAAHAVSAVVKPRGPAAPLKPPPPRPPALAAAPAALSLTLPFIAALLCSAL